MSEDLLVECLDEARRVGDLGPADPALHVAHADRLVRLCDPPDRFCDLGTGAGVPGLICALRWPTAHGVLLDGSTARCERLSARVRSLGLAGRISVQAGRAEELGHAPLLRESFDLLTARAFGAPPVTAECAAGFVRVGGRIAISEPPEATGDRWDADGLSALGLEFERVEDGWAFLRKVSSTPPRFPRRVGVPNKRPLW